MQKIAKKLVQVMQECRYIQKTGTNEFHHYRYATSAEVLEKINTALVKQKLCSVAVPEILQQADVTTAKGTIEHMVTVKIDITLIDVDSGESVSFSGIGTGQDGGDKAVMKAQTAALKYAYLITMLVSTGDDPEADAKTDEITLVPVQKNQTLQNDVSICSTCGFKLTPGVRNVSLKKFGRPLCMQCQKKAQGAA
jgi:hypothetical protein